MTLEEWAASLSDKATQIEHSSPQRIRALGQQCLDRARELSSGAVSTEELRDDPWNHPYGHGETDYRGRVRGPIPYGDSAMINEQTGEFKAGWHLEEIPHGFILINNSEHAAELEFPGPESPSIKRPILEAVASEVIGPHIKEHGIKNFKLEIS